MTRRLTQRGRERRQQLMQFAAGRFAEQGYHPTSVAEIVQGLGVGKGVFYWYFSSKEELFLEILKEAQQDLRRTQQQAIDGVDDPLRRIEQGIQASMRWSSEHPELYNLFAFAATCALPSSRTSNAPTRPSATCARRWSSSTPELDQRPTTQA
jgi:AcrR family transcriptional regulator